MQQDEAVTILSETSMAPRVFGHFPSFPALFGFAFALCSASSAHAQAHDAPAEEAEAQFVPQTTLDLAALERVVRERAPELQDVELAVEMARSEVQQSEILPNPVLDGGAATLPLGDTNPQGLAQPWANVPNYSVGLSYTIPIGKRGPRQDRARAEVTVASASLQVAVRDRALYLASRLGRIATLELRLAGMRSLANQGAEAIRLAEVRVASKFGIPLEVDRLRIEVDRTHQMILEAEGELSGALSECAALVGRRCESFPSTDAARTFLSSWTREVERASPRLEERADLRALVAARDSAQAEIAAARAQAIPDPTVRLGYTHDRFLISGNQQNSFSVNLSLPLPVFDHGQAQRRAAEARLERASIERTRRLAATRAAIPALRLRIATHLKQQETLEKDLLPRAREVLASLERSAESGLVPLTDTLQARRTLGELLVEEASSYQDAFDASLELLSNLAPPSARTPDSNGSTR